MATSKQPTLAGEKAYELWRAQLREDPEYLAVYEKEAAKSELWLQLVEARLDAGLTQQEVAHRLGVSLAQIARIENRGYDICSLNTLRRYLKALGNDFQLEVRVRRGAQRATA